MAYLPSNFLVWGELPVTDLKRAITFYETVTQAELTIDTNGPNPMVIFPVKDSQAGIGLSMYPGQPAARGTGSTLHLSAPGPLEDTMQRVRDAGGEVVSDPIPIPGGRFFYALDLDGNSVGFYQSE